MSKRKKKKNVIEKSAQRKQAPDQEQDDDESFAERAIQAQIDEECGIYNPDQDWLLP